MMHTAAIVVKDDQHRIRLACTRRPPGAGSPRRLDGRPWGQASLGGHAWCMASPFGTDSPRQANNTRPRTTRRPRHWCMAPPDAAAYLWLAGWKSAARSCLFIIHPTTFGFCGGQSPRPPHLLSEQTRDIKPLLAQHWTNNGTMYRVCRGGQKSRAPADRPDRDGPWHGVPPCPTMPCHVLAEDKGCSGSPQLIAYKWGL